jgi:hypothetical protein
MLQRRVFTADTVVMGPRLRRDDEGAHSPAIATFMLGIRGRHAPLKALPVALNNAPTPVGIITLKNRTLTPPAQLMIEHIRTLAKGLV